MNRLLLPLFLFSLGCSGAPTQSDGHARCIDICGAEFSQCTNHNPGDFTACADRRRQCDNQCTGDAAERDVPTSQEEIITPSEAFDRAPDPEPKPESDPQPEPVPESQPEE